MAEVFAGFVSGYVLALISAPVLAIALIRMRASSPMLARLLPAETPAVGIVVVLHGGLLIGWTGLGILLGLLLYAMRDGPSFGGSLNAPFTLFVAGTVLALSAPVIVLLPGFKRLAAGAAVSALILFGWLMPYLAEWSTFGR